MGCGQSKAHEPTSKGGKAPEPEVVTAPPPAAANSNTAENPVESDKPAPAEEARPVPRKAASDLPIGSNKAKAGEPTECSPVQAPTHAPSAPVIKDSVASSPTPERDGGDAGALGKTDSNGRRHKPAATMPAAFYKNGMHNGFKSIPEVPSFDCDEAFQAKYSLPAECLQFEPASEAVVTKFKNGDQERKIHNNIELSTSELERLQGMREEAKAQGVEFYPSVTSMATRFLSRARMDSRKAVKLMKETNEWRKEYFSQGPITSDSVRQDLKHGIVYFIGRDSSLRPAIVIRANRIPQQWYKEKQIDRFIRMLIFCMEYFLRYMVVPGRVENLNVIVDLATLGISQVPLSALGEVYKVMSHHYIGRVYKFFVCNVSTTLSTIAGMAKGFLTDRQKQKLNMLDDPKELRKEFALSQLESDLGGSRPKVTEFFPFPLMPGPFQAGYDGPVNTDSVEMVHEVLSMSGAIGRLWDPKHNAEINRRLEYSAKAVDILEKCGLPVPPEARVDAEGVMGPGYSSIRAGSAASMPDDIPGSHPEASKPSVETATTATMGLSVEEGEEDVLVDPNIFLPKAEEAKERDLQSPAVCGGSGSFFCCSA